MLGRGGRSQRHQEWKCCRVQDTSSDHYSLFGTSRGGYPGLHSKESLEVGSNKRIRRQRMWVLKSLAAFR